MGAAAGPDARLQGAQGRLHRQHPGHPRGGGEDRLEAGGDVGLARRAVRPPRRGHAREAAGAADRVPRPGDGEPRADAPRARRGPPARHVERAGGGLRPRDGRPAVPRVRVPDADRPAAAAHRGAARGRDRGDARAAGRRVPRGPGRGVAWRRGGRRGPARGHAVGRRAAPAVARLRPDRPRVGRHATASARRSPSADADGDAAAEARAERVAVAAGDVPGALAAAIADPGRIEVVDADGVAGLEAWLRDQEVVGTGLVLDDPAAARRDTARARRRGTGRARRRGRRA